MQPSYKRSTKLKMAAVAILNVMPLSILVTRLIFRSDELQSCKIWLMYVNRRLSYYCLCENPRWRPSPSCLFIFVQYYGIAVCKTSNLVHLPNFVQMRAKASELWAINEIQDGGRRHLEFATIFNFGHMPIFRSDELQSCKIWLIYVNCRLRYYVLCKKNIMAVSAILDCNFVTLDPLRNPLVDVKLPFKFRVDRVRTFRDITIRKFRKFGLKCLF